MRQLATLPSADAAQTLADYLLTLHIDTKTERQPEGWAVWVCDEDHVTRARQELEEFTRNPSDPRYKAASGEADALRRQKVSIEKAYHRRQNRFNRRMSAASTAGPWTIGLIVVSALVTLFSQGGEWDSFLVQTLSISPYQYVLVWNDPTGPRSPDEEPDSIKLDSPKLGPILQGQVWRLVTPMFIHFTILHLVFNMSWLYALGGAIERRRGPLRYLALVLILAIVSNLAQYFWSGPTFGGMSGVVYGLFGYIWMKARFQPELGLGLSPNSITIMMLWFFLCMTPWIHFLIGSGVANVAHASGLLAGILLGYAPVLWQSSPSAD